MKRKDWLEKWGLSDLKLKLGFLEDEFSPHDPDRSTAWDIHVELLTRITTQYPPAEDCDKMAAPDSIYALFPLTRDILRRHGSGSGEFTKLAIPVLNQIIRPFIARSHRLSLAGVSRHNLQPEFPNRNWPTFSRTRESTHALAAMTEMED
jgi:hypothetical protein